MLSRAHADIAAELLQIMDARAQAAARRDTGVEGDIGARLAEQPFLFPHHAAAVGADEAIVQEADVGEIFGRLAVAYLFDRGDLAPDLVEVDGRDRVELVLQGAQLAQQVGRAHVGRPGRNADGDAAVARAMPLRVQRFGPGDAVVAERRVDIERSGIADIALGLVPGFLAQQQAQSGVGDALRVILDVAAVFERRRRAAADRFQRGEPHHRDHFIPARAPAPAAARARW